ncbi:MAG: SDR family oxidoreductase [Proteobacteria bacterium]|nr:SDR family oxidoreductase [Pseudomonadota bacterium]MBU1452078.1 SDR family oxidoreductase [Pseudomonadota bacterium]MBU2467275.1 SDR family oxidoreductase [Pseudomonadota bacterium]MBU2517360.1 SDR family oxidoreductase [Pseudomonadota bacterium]
MQLPYFDLSGKLALVSGGATGIGLGISEGLAEAGARVIVCSRRLEVCQQAAGQLAAKTGAQVQARSCDVTDEGQVDSLVAEVLAMSGGIDILVNCAGVGGSEKPILEMSSLEWDSVIDINLKGAYILSRAVAGPMMEAGRGGRIINVASVGAIIAYPNMSAYCASKGGLVQLTKVMALEWVRHAINVNAILPGYFETPMNTEFFASEAGRAAIKRQIPMRRLAQIEEIKGLAILLASPASSFMTGSAVVIDGGNTAW